MAGRIQYTASPSTTRDYAAVFSRTQPILGIPGKGEIYGYLAHDERLAFVTVVNPGLFAQSFAVPVSSVTPPPAFSKLVFSNDGQAKGGMTRVASVVSGELIPGEIRVYAIGSREAMAAISLPPAATRQYHRVTPIVDPFGEKREAGLRIVPAQVGKTLAVVIQYLKDGEADRSFDRPQEVMKITGVMASAPVTFTSIPAAGTNIWSRCSWAVFKHKIVPGEAGKSLRLKLIGEPPSGTTWRITTVWLQ